MAAVLLAFKVNKFHDIELIIFKDKILTWYHLHI